LSIWCIFLIHILSDKSILLKHRLSSHILSELENHSSDQPGKSIEDIQSNDNHAAIAHQELTVGCLNEISEAYDVIAYKDCCDFIKNFLPVYLVVNERSAVNKIDDIELR